MTDTAPKVRLDVDGSGSRVALDQFVSGMEKAGRAADATKKKTDDLTAAVERQQRVVIRPISEGAVQRQIEAIQAKVDPTFAAQRRIDQARARIERSVGLGVTTREQGDELLAKYKLMVERSIGVASPAAAPAVVDRGADIAAYGQQLDTLRAKYNPIYAASRQYKASLIEIAEAAKVGAISEQERAAAVEKAKAVLASQVAALKGGAAATNSVSAANDNLVKSSGLARHELINLGRQAQDVAVSLQGGQGLFTVLLQQGSQIVDVFAASKTGTVRGFFGQLMSYVTPTRVAVVGLTAALGIAAYAASGFAEEQRELQRSLYGTGLAAGVTRKQLDDLAVAGAGGSTSRSDMRSTLGALANTGRIDPSMLGSIAGASRTLQGTLAIEAAEANKLLAESFAAPERGYRTLTDRLGGFDITVQRNVQSLMAQGRTMEAQQILLATLQSRMAPLNESTSNMARAWGKVTAAISDTIDTIGRLVSSPIGRFLENLEKAPERIAEARRAAGDTSGVPNAGRWGQSIAQRMPTEVEDDTTRMKRLTDAVAEAQRRLDWYRSHRSNDPMDVADRPQELARRERALAEAQARLDQATGQNRPAGPALTAPAQAPDEAAAAARREQERMQAAINGGAALARQNATPTSQQIGELEGLTNGWHEARRAVEAYLKVPAERRSASLLREMREAEEVRRDMLQNRLRDGTQAFDANGRLILSQEQLNAAMKTTAEITREEARLRRNLESAQANGNEGLILAGQRALERHRERQRGLDAGTNRDRDARVEQGLAATRGGNDDVLATARRDRQLAANENIAALRRENEAVGQGVAALERLRIEQQMLAEAKRRYQILDRIMPQEEINAIREAAAEMGRLREQAALTRLQRDATFDRQTMFMSDGERGIAQAMRNVYGNDWQSFMDSAEAGMMRVNNALRQGADYAVDFARGFTQDIRNGVGVLDALGNAFLRVGQRIMDAQLEQMIRGLFGLGGSSGSFGGMGMPNLLGEFFGLFGFMPGMSAGGYTGPGGVNQPAGVVHKGEVVWSQRDVARAGGVGAVEAMRLGMAGYASGGAAGYRPLPAAANFNRPPMVFGGNVFITNNGAPVQAQAKQDSRGNWNITLSEVKDQIAGGIAQDLGQRRGPVGAAISGTFSVPQNGGLVG